MEVSRHLSIDYSGILQGPSERQRESDEASALARQLEKGVRLDGQDEWNAALPSFNADVEGEIKGYHGLWRFYKPLGAHDACLEQKFHCIRTYTFKTPKDGSVPKLLFRNYHDGTATFVSSGTRKRSQDDLYEDAFTRYLTDPYFSCQLMKLDPSEEAEGLPPCCFRRSVPIRSINCAVRLPPALPPKPLEGTDGKQPSTLLGHPERGVKGPTAWGFEVFIQDGDCRWSMGPMYDIQNLEFLSHFYIREYVTPFDPEKAMDMAKQPWKSARKTLDGAPSMWMDGGSWTGQMTDIIWDEDGEMLRLRPRPAVWTPPEPLRRSHRLYLYDDLMYAYYPARKLPAVEVDAEPTFLNGIRFECGGFMRNEEAFRRVVLRYSVNGQIDSVTEEVYRPPGASAAQSPTASQ